MIRRTETSRLASITAAALLVVAAAPLRAQQPSPAVALVAGAFQYDLSGVGTAPFAGLRLELPRSRAIVLEPGLTVARYAPQGSATDVWLLIPEVQLQLVRPGGRVRPFVGVGAGSSVAFGSGRTESDLTLSAGAGVRLRLSAAWAGRAELRLRAIDPWTGSAAEWTLGLARHF